MSKWGEKNINNAKLEDVPVLIREGRGREEKKKHFQGHTLSFPNIPLHAAVKISLNPSVEFSKIMAKGIENLSISLTLFCCFVT